MKGISSSYRLYCTHQKSYHGTTRSEPAAEQDPLYGLCAHENHVLIHLFACSHLLLLASHDVG